MKKITAMFNVKGGFLLNCQILHVAYQFLM